MKRLYLQLLLLAGLLAPAFAYADRDDGRRGFGADGVQWRLNGYRIEYRHPGDRRWHRAPGSATDIGDGWVIGTDRRNGGYGIYRWNGFDWQRMPGSGIDIGGSFRNPWVVNDRGERFNWSGNGWREDRNYRRDDRRYDRRDERRDDRGDRRDGDWDRDEGRGERRGERRDEP